MAGTSLKSGSRVLVTGAAGFIGRRLCQRLKDEGVTVRALLRRPAEGPWQEQVVADLTAPVPEDLARGVDVVFHLAGKAHALAETKQDEAEYRAINVEGTRRLLEAAVDGGARGFIFFSSVKAVGEGGKRCLDESADLPAETPYGRSKREAERLVLEHEALLHRVVLRPSMVYGPTRKGNLPRMVEAVARNRFPPLPEVGNRRSMIHVDDVVEAALLAARDPAAHGATYILTDGQDYSTRQIYEWILEALGRPVPRWSVPLAPLRLAARVGDLIGAVRGRRFFFDRDALEKLTGSACYDSSRIERELGFEPCRTLRQTLPEIVQALDLS